MKKINIVLLSLLVSIPFALKAQTVKTLQQVMELKVPREGGANAAGVAWHPIENKYYAAMAGNVDFCLSVYSSDGKLLSAPEQKTMFDIRGIWYNPTKKKIQMNGYDKFGWAEYNLDKKGIPEASTILFSGAHQPTVHASGSFDARDNSIYFFNERRENIMKYSLLKGEPVDTIIVLIGAANQEEDDDILLNMLEDVNYDVLDDYNITTMIYTGTLDAEFGFLNIGNNRVELYSRKTGYKTVELNLPKKVKTYGALNFAYANGIYWFFDKESRTWYGYK